MTPAKIANHLACGRSFALETILSGLGYARQIPQWRASGYAVALPSLTLSNAKMSIERVALRVRQQVTAALVRAAERARFIAEQTGTKLIAILPPAQTPPSSPSAPKETP